MTIIEAPDVANLTDPGITEDDLYETFFQLDRERAARLASVENEAGVAAVERLAATQRTIADEVTRRRDPAVRVAAATAAVPTLPPDTRPKPRKRARLEWKPLHPFVH